MKTELRYASGDADVVAIHAFLCIVAGPTLPGPIGPKDSATEVWRVVNDECALMAMQGDILVGTLGIIRPKWWWNNDCAFLVNRWFFALPGQGAGRLLLDEGIKIATDAGLELHIIDEAKQRYKIFNRDPRRTATPPLILQPRPQNHPSTQTLQ